MRNRKLKNGQIFFSVRYFVIYCVLDCTCQRFESSGLLIYKTIKMNSFNKTIYACLFIYFVAVISAYVFNDSEKMANVGLAILLLSILFFVLGIIAVIPKVLREIGKGLLISAGVAFLIGLSICSVFQIKI
jgi:hypothetical protein